jgi:hypothetical protein
MAGGRQLTRSERREYTWLRKNLKRPELKKRLQAPGSLVWQPGLCRDSDISYRDVWTMFLTGLAIGGHLFTIGGREEGLAVLVPALWMIGNIGSGLLYIFCWLMNIGFVDTPEAAARLTFEYGNTFLVVAGLVNYLAMLDAFDIAAGRKK